MYTANRLKGAAQESSTERETREKGQFSATEQELLSRRGPSTAGHFFGKALALLGNYNPLAREVDPATESVWLLDNIAYRPRHSYPHGPQPFQANYVAAYFKRNTGKDLSAQVANIAEKVGLSQPGMSEAETKARIAERLQPFADTIVTGLSVTIHFPHGHEAKLGPGDSSAVSSNVILTPSTEPLADGKELHICTTPASLLPYGNMSTYIADEQGWLIVSDIDDSIKITMTPSPIGILQSTFVSDPLPVPGMPELYAKIHTLLTPTWYYLSASPYNLYPFLRRFLHSQYPHGEIMLREASWMDIRGILQSLTQGTQTYKRDRMINIHTWLPKRKVICVGDSTQSDPEAYGDICRLYPGWVKKVFIRKVVDVSEMKGTSKNDTARFEKAFRGVDKAVWEVFEQPDALFAAVEAIKRANPD